MAPPGNQAANRENKHQPVVSVETGLLDSIENGHSGGGKIYRRYKEDFMKKAKGKVIFLSAALLVVLSLSIFIPDSIAKPVIRHDNGNGIYVGAAKVVITPNLQKVSPYVGKNDDLHARCVLISWKNIYVALVSLDLLGVGLTDIVLPIRNKVNETYGIPGDYVLIGSTHTHASGVDVQGVYGGNTKPYIFKEYKPFLIEKIVEVVGLALNDLRRSTVQIGTIWVNNLTFNRRYYPAEGPKDDELTALRFRDLDNQTIATLVNFPSHPVITMTGNLISADFVGYLCGRLEDEFGGVGIFFNGAQGNINPFMFIKYNSPYQRGDPKMYEAAEEFGNDLAEYAMQALNGGKVFKNLPLEVAKVSVDLPLENQSFIWAILNGLIIRQIIPVDGGYIMQTEVSGIKMGPIEMLTVPGELFSELALLLKGNMPKYGFLLGLTTEALGYIIPPDQWNPGAGEVGESMSVGPKTAPILVDALLQTISELEYDYEGARLQR